MGFLEGAFATLRSESPKVLACRHTGQVQQILTQENYLCGQQESAKRLSCEFTRSFALLGRLSHCEVVPAHVFAYKWLQSFSL
jgi:hypothetical protein